MGLTVHYSITRVTEDQKTFTTYLTAKVAPWSDIASTFYLDFGQITQYPQVSALLERSFLSGLEGDLDRTKSIAFNMSAGTKGLRTNVYTEST